MEEMIFYVGVSLLVIVPILLLIGTPICTSMGLGSVAAMCVILGVDKVDITAAQRIYTGMNSFALLAIPFFVLAGYIMNNGGIAQRLINLAKALIGFIPGALAHINIVANMLFGAISGSGVAAAAAIGGILGPVEKKEGYDPAVSATVNIASAPSGMLIPPSNTFIIYSLASGGTSVAALFVAGYLPGIIWGLSCMLVTAYFVHKFGYKTTSNYHGMGERVKVFIDAIPALFLIIVIVGGIISGIFTPTEASCIAVVYALLLSLIYRSIKLKDIPPMLLATAKSTGLIIFLIGVSAVLSWVMAFAKIPGLIASTLLAISSNPVIILLMMNVIMLFIGCIMDPTPAILIFAPIFLPVVQKFGYNVVHFGVIMVFNLCIGTITPPVGPILFTGCKIANQKIENVFFTLIPYFVVLSIALMLVTFVPELSTWLPRAMHLMQ